MELMYNAKEAKEKANHYNDRILPSIKRSKILQSINIGCQKGITEWEIPAEDWNNLLNMN